MPVVRAEDVIELNCCLLRCMSPLLAHSVIRDVSAVWSLL
jgi:hypothetical protein